MIYKPQSKTPTPTNTRDNQIAKRKCMNITNRKQGKMAPSEPSYSTTASHGFLQHLRKGRSQYKIASHGADRRFHELHIYLT